MAKLPINSRDAVIEKMVANDQVILQKAAAMTFGSTLIDKPLGATPEAIINYTLISYFSANPWVVSDTKKMKEIGKELKALSKMDIKWNTDLIPAPLADLMGLPVEKEETLAMVSDMIDTLNEGRQPVKETISMRPEVWNGRSGRLKIVLKANREVGYCHRKGNTGPWTIYKDIGENAKQVAKDVITKDLLKAVKQAFGDESLVEAEGGIQNPNSSGQGTDPNHTKHHLNRVVTKYGYQYSHTTPVKSLSGSTYLHDTYKRGTHNVSLMRDQSRPLDRWETSVSTASGTKQTGMGMQKLDAHLQSKSRRYPELRGQQQSPATQPPVTEDASTSVAANKTAIVSALQAAKKSNDTTDMFLIASTLVGFLPEKELQQAFTELSSKGYVSKQGNTKTPWAFQDDE